MEIFKNEFVSLCYEPNDRVLLQKWQGYVPSELFRRVIDMSVQFIREHEVDMLISDTLMQKVVRKNDALYAASRLAEMFADGLKAMAFVIPSDAFTRISLKKFADEGINSDSVGYFQSMEEALNWAGIYSRSVSEISQYGC